MNNPKRSLIQLQVKRPSKQMSQQTSLVRSKKLIEKAPNADLMSTGAEFNKSINRLSNTPKQQITTFQKQQQDFPDPPDLRGPVLMTQPELIRGTFQREQITVEEKQKALDQKRRMKEELEQQIEEKKSKLIREKQQEKERQKQEEERITRETQYESQVRSTPPLSTHIPPYASSRVSTIDFFSMKNPQDTHLRAPSTGKPASLNPIEGVEILHKVQSAQGFYKQSELIEFLRRQNENLRAENEKKDGIISGLIRQNRPPQLTSNLIQSQNMIKSQSSKQLRQLPKSQQEKKNHVQRLPVITTPQPQLNHFKQQSLRFDEELAHEPKSKVNEEDQWSFGGQAPLIPKRRIKDDQLQPLRSMDDPPFLKTDFNAINPEFTFSSSMAEKMREQRRKEKLPKEFQIFPTRRKFFV